MTHDATGLLNKADDVRQQLESGRMPYLGTTMQHAKGLELVLGFLQTL